MKTIVGLYDNVTDAQQAVQALTNAGFDRDRISLVLHDREGAYSSGLGHDATLTDTSDDIGAGVATGAAVGGLGGLLIGLSALAIPGIGPVVAAGPLVAGLVGAGVGAAVGGLVGALASAGVPEEQAHYYVEGVRRGGALVTVEANDEEANEVADIMNRYHPVDIEERARNWRASGWSGSDEETSFADAVDERRQLRSNPSQSSLEADRSPVTAQSYTPIQNQSNVRSGDFDSTFRTHYQTHYSNFGRGYEEYEPAYHYGYTLANDNRYRDRDWATIETDIRQDWSQRYPNSRWEEFKDAVRHGWQQVKQKVAA
jgi:hypothetical protein